jgi:SAM-dependent methyltransferase
VTTEGFEPEAFAQLAELEAQSWWFRSRNRLIAWTVREYFPNARRILEIGCGTGFTLGALAEGAPTAELTGTELFDEGLEVARGRMPGASLMQADARHLPFGTEFDLVGAFDVIEHIDDDMRALREMHRVLNPGGGVIVTVPQHPWLWSASDNYARHERRYTRKLLRARLEEAGFAVERLTSFVTLLLPLMVVSRYLGRGGASDDPQAELKLPRVVDLLFEGTARMEQLAIMRGASLPAGGSLMAVARARSR